MALQVSSLLSFPWDAKQTKGGGFGERNELRITRDTFYNNRLHMGGTWSWGGDGGGYKLNSTLLLADSYSTQMPNSKYSLYLLFYSMVT